MEFRFGGGGGGGEGVEVLLMQKLTIVGSHGGFTLIGFTFGMDFGLLGCYFRQCGFSLAALYSQFSFSETKKHYSVDMHWRI